MSVYTSLNNLDLAEFLQTYSVGELTGFQGISEGIENTNYFVTTRLKEQERQFVLTIFESLGFEELPYFLELMAFLSEHNLPCAHPVANKQREYLQKLKNKPSALVQRLQGKNILTPDANHCRQVGKVLARMHVAGGGFSLRRNNPRELQWAQHTAGKVMEKLNKADRKMLESELTHQQQLDFKELPSGVIHADLFRDNVLFNGDTLSGVIDFYYACDGSYLYDLAITVNDWCFATNAKLDKEKLQAMIDGYQEVRNISEQERCAWPDLLRAAALRFWLSRLLDWHFPRDGDLTHRHDPDAFRDILKHRIKNTKELATSWAQ